MTKSRKRMMFTSKRNSILLFISVLEFLVWENAEVSMWNEECTLHSPTIKPPPLKYRKRTPVIEMSNSYD